MDSDEVLVERYRNGEENAFNELIRRFQKPIYFLALKLMGNSEIAD